MGSEMCIRDRGRYNSPGTETVKCFYGFNFLQKWEIDPLKFFATDRIPRFCFFFNKRQKRGIRSVATNSNGSISHFVLKLFGNVIDKINYRQAWNLIRG